MNVINRPTKKLMKPLRNKTRSKNRSSRTSTSFFSCLTMKPRQTNSSTVAIDATMIPVGVMPR